MKLAIKIISILFIAGLVGFYVGTRNRDVEVLIYDPNTKTSGQLSVVSGTSTSIVLKADQISSSSVLEDVFGQDAPKLLLSLPWYVTRAAAISAYLLMFFIIVWGSGMTTGYIYHVTNPIEAWGIHKYMSISFGILILVHVISLLFDKFVNFSLIDVLVPYAAGIKPLYLSMGIIGFYILLLVIVSSLLSRLKIPRLWRAVHYLVYPLFAVSLVHGLYMGTDSKTQVMQIIYQSTGIVFAILMIYRFVWFPIKNRA